MLQFMLQVEWQLFGRDPHHQKRFGAQRGISWRCGIIEIFYRDIGYDLEFDYIKDHIDPSGNTCFTGFKYHKITGNSDYKEVYNPYTALEKPLLMLKIFTIKEINNLNI